MRGECARGKREATIAGRFAGWFVTFQVFVVTVVFFRAADIESAVHMIKAMAGFGNAPYAEIMHVGWDQWGIRVGYVSENFVRSWLGGYWSVVGMLLTAGALAIAFFIPDTIELVNYREGEPYHDWRRNVGVSGVAAVTPLALGTDAIVDRVVRKHAPVHRISLLPVLMSRPRTFVFTMLTGAFGVLIATMAINFTLDPQYVFGTPLTHEDENANYRYHRLQQYQAKRDQIDGLLFASSRGKAFDAELVAQKMGAKAVAKFDVTAGMITDHLPALEYVLRDKASAAKRS